MPKKLDITGQRFGKLIVQEYVYSKNHRSYWKCICDCGCETIRMVHSLKTGNTQSCGCSKKDKNMHTHHIWRWLKYPSIRYELWNGITLCKECHRKIYKKENEFAFNFMIKNRMLEVN